MITLEIYSEICEKMLKDGFPSSHIIDYKVIEEKWGEMVNLNKEKLRFNNINSDNLVLSNLFALRWGITSLAISNSDNDQYAMLFGGLFATIANTIFAVNKLAIDGFDYQASSLIRSLYEQCFMLLSIIIEPEKRNALIDSAANDDEYNTWRKHFSFKHLDRTIQCYENKISEIEPTSFLNTWRKRNYSTFSSYVHNDYASFLLYGLALPDNDQEELQLNLWGSYSTRTDIITGNANALLWYTELLFMKLLTDKDIDIKPEILYKADGDKRLWNLASFLGLFAKEYYMQIREVDESIEHI